MNLPNPLHFALIVAICRYPGGFKELEGPLNDAKAFADWLEKPDGGGLMHDNITCVETPLSPPSMTIDTAAPRKTAIDRALEGLRGSVRTAIAKLPEEEQISARDRTRLYIYVAGHGVMPRDGTAALLDAEATPTTQHNLDLGAYAKWLEREGAFAELAVFGDCCRNYKMLMAAQGPNFLTQMQVGGPVAWCIGYATAGGTTAWEDSETYEPEIPADERRGYFSRALVEGLEGKGANPATGYVTPHHLHQYVVTAVRRRTANRKEHEQQDVLMPTSSAQEMRFGPRHEVHRYKIVIHFRPGAPQEVELVGPGGEVAHWKPQEGPWTYFCYDGLWQVQRVGSDRDSAGLTDGGIFRVTGDDRDVQL